MLKKAEEVERGSEIMRKKAEAGKRKGNLLCIILEILNKINTKIWILLIYKLQMD